MTSMTFLLINARRGGSKWHGEVLISLSHIVAVERYQDGLGVELTTGQTYRLYDPDAADIWERLAGSYRVVQP